MKKKWDSFAIPFLELPDSQKFSLPNLQNTWVGELYISTFNRFTV
jgi:hypothetical protein